MLERNYSTPWLLFKMMDKESRNLMQKYTYFPTQAKFLKIKQILENAEPVEQVRDMECFKDFKRVLPKLKTSFIVRKVTNGMNLEKI
jgi:CRISPR/Cas system Type II protein with McrA/HNH and RuvC-like nuclease domain